MRKCILVAVFIVTFTLSMSFVSNKAANQTIANETLGNHELSDYTPHTPIVINHNDNFTQQGWPGSGTQESPYLIQNLEIVLDSANIRICNVSVWFKIYNCNLTSSQSLPYDSTRNGVHLENTRHGIIESCWISLKSNGIHFNNCSDCTILKCTITNSYSASWLLSCHGCDIAENTVSDNQNGFGLEKNEDCVIRKNIMTNQPNGAIELVTKPFCRNILIDNNTVTGGEVYGIGISFAINCTVSNNIVHDNGMEGIIISHQVYNCTCKANHVYEHVKNGIGMANCVRATVSNNKVHNNAWHGIYLKNATECVIISNEVFENEKYGIYLDVLCSMNTLYGNRIGPNTKGNAYDDGHDNQWDDGVSHGNYWSDYSTDQAYAITGDAGSTDRWPASLTAPTTAVTTDGLDPTTLMLLGGAAVAAVLIVSALVLKKSRT